MELTRIIQVLVFLLSLLTISQCTQINHNLVQTDISPLTIFAQLSLKEDEDTEYYELLDEYIAMLKIAVEIFFDNLFDGLDVMEALETDMALRAVIAVSEDFANAFNSVSNMMEEGISIAEIKVETEAEFVASYQEAATMIIYLAELVDEESAILDEAIIQFYDDIENGLSLTEALENNADLTEAISVSTDLEEALDDLYNAVEDGVSFAEALDLYQYAIDEAIASAIYLVVDITVQEIEVEIEVELSVTGTNEAIVAWFAEYERIGNFRDALSASYRLLAAMEVYEGLADIIYELVDEVESGTNYIEADEELADEIQTAIVTSAQIIIEEDIDLYLLMLSLEEAQ